jgi:hypothetical protein
MAYPTGLRVLKRTADGGLYEFDEQTAGLLLKDGTYKDVTDDPGINPERANRNRWMLRTTDGQTFPYNDQAFNEGRDKKLFEQITYEQVKQLANAPKPGIHCLKPREDVRESPMPPIDAGAVSITDTIDRLEPGVQHQTSQAQETMDDFLSTVRDQTLRKPVRENEAPVEVIPLPLGTAPDAPVPLSELQTMTNAQLGHLAHQYGVKVDVKRTPKAELIAAVQRAQQG